MAMTETQADLLNIIESVYSSSIDAIGHPKYLEEEAAWLVDFQDGDRVFRAKISLEKETDDIQIWLPAENTDQQEG